MVLDSGADRKFSTAGYLEMEVPGIASGQLSVVPTGLFVSRFLYPGLRPGLSSAVPAGLNLELVGSHAHALAPEVQLGNDFSIKPGGPERSVISRVPKITAQT